MTTKLIYLSGIQNRSIEFLEDFPTEPRAILYGTPMYRIRVRIGGNVRLLELYHGRVIRQLKAAGNLIGRTAMIQLPEQEGAEWGVRIF